MEKRKRKVWPVTEIFVACLCFGLVPLFLVSGCGVVKPTPGPSIRDSSRVEVRWKIERIHDTLRFPVPQIVERNVTRDTSSHLENDWAKSDAVISDGLLYHSLETKPRDVPVPVDKEIVYKDSIVFRDREVKVPEPYPVEIPAELTRWQQFRLRAFWPLTLAAVGPWIWKYRSKLLKILRKLIGLFI